MYASWLDSIAVSDQNSSCSERTGLYKCELAPSPSSSVELIRQPLKGKMHMVNTQTLKVYFGKNVYQNLVQAKVKWWNGNHAGRNGGLLDSTLDLGPTVRVGLQFQLLLRMPLCSFTPSLWGGGLNERGPPIAIGVTMDLSYSSISTEHTTDRP